MKLSRLLNDWRKIHKHRAAVRTFLRICESPDQAYLGSIRSQELGFLQELVQKANSIPGPIIEVGTLFGFTTQRIADWKQTEKELISIDDFSWNPIGLNPKAHREFTSRILYYVVENCSTRLFDGTIKAFYCSYSGPRPSLVLIDAGHTYREVIVDIQWAKQVRCPVIAGHDYSDAWPGVKRAVDECFGEAKEIVGSLWAHVSNSGAR